MVRELTLMAVGGASGLSAPVSQRLSQISHTLGTAFSEGRAAVKRLAVAAADAGQRRTRLVLTLPLEAVAAAEAYLVALDEADACARTGQLLTLEIPATHRVFRRWYVENWPRTSVRRRAASLHLRCRPLRSGCSKRSSWSRPRNGVAERTARLQRVTAALAAAVTSEEVARAVVSEGVATMAASGGAMVVPQQDETGALQALGAVGYTPDHPRLRGLRSALHTPGPKPCRGPGPARGHRGRERAGLRDAVGTPGLHQQGRRGGTARDPGAGPTRCGPTRLAGAYVSASKDALIGGDHYEVVMRADTVRMMMGDVRGKGLDAVRLATVVLGLFRAAAADHEDLRAVAQQMTPGCGPYLSDEDFVTALLVDIHPDGTVRQVSCGHPPPLLARAGLLSLIGCKPTVPLGLGADPEAAVLTFQREDRLLRYTDGLVESRDQVTGEFLDLQDTARPLLGGEVAGVLGSILARVQDAAGQRLSDDLAMLVVEFARSRSRSAARRRAGPRCPWTPGTRPSSVRASGWSAVGVRAAGGPGLR